MNRYLFIKQANDRNYPIAQLENPQASGCTLEFHVMDHYIIQICPGLKANEIQIPYDKHCKVSSLVKSQQKTQFCQM